MNDNTGGSFRVKRNPFTQVSNSALRDDSLSLKAKGLYSLIQSYITIPNFTLYKGHLMSLCKEKEKAFDSAWKELKDNGYLKQYRIPKGKNDTFVYEYDLLDVADLTTPSLINLNKNGEEIKNNNENTEQKDSDSHTPHLVPYAESTLCQKHPMPEAPYAERGGNNNIGFKKDFKKEDFNNNYTESSHTSTSDSTTELSTSTTERADRTKTIDSDTQQTINFEMKKGLPQPAADQSTGLQSPSANTQYSTNDFNIIERAIQDNISYNYFLQDGNDIDLINNFVACMVDTMLTDNSVKVTIDKETKPISVIKSVLMKLKYEHIQHAIDQYKGQHHKITYKRPYIRNMLYNTYLEMDAHYTNAVRADGVVW